MSTAVLFTQKAQTRPVVEAKTEVFFRHHEHRVSTKDKVLGRIIRSSRSKLISVSTLEDWMRRQSDFSKVIAQAIRGSEPTIVIAVGPEALQAIADLKEKHDVPNSLRFIYLPRTRKNKQSQKKSRDQVLEDAIAELHAATCTAKLSNAKPQVVQTALEKHLHMTTSPNYRHLNAELNRVNSPSPYALIGPINNNRSVSHLLDALLLDKTNLGYDSLTVGAPQTLTSHSKIVVTPEQSQFSPEYQRFIRGEMSHWTHVLIESGRPMLGGQFGNSSRNEIVALQANGSQVGLIIYPSDMARFDELKPLIDLADTCFVTSEKQLELIPSGNLIGGDAQAECTVKNDPLTSFFGITTVG
ncbi:MAG: hypothetical protein WAS05_07720 [Candidatus Nanopelagicales bacterium]